MKKDIIIRLNRDMAKRIKRLKITDNESYNSIIKRLLGKKV